MASTTNENVWRPDCSDLGFEDEQFAVGKGESRKVFHVHRKIILACGSPVFQELFSEDLTDEKGSIIEIDDDPEAFELLMNHLYGNCSEIKSLKSVCKLHAIGEKYHVPKILDIAKQYTESIEIKENDFFDEIESSNFAHPLLLQKMLSYLKENAESLILSERFLNVPERFVEGVLQMDKINIREYDLLLAVTNWGYRNLQHGHSESLMKFYKHIRFSNLTCDEYFQFINSYPEAIEPRSSLDILKYLYFPYTRLLPEWCSSSEISRKNAFYQEETNQMFVSQSKDLLITQDFQVEEIFYD